MLPRSALHSERDYTHYLQRFPGTKKSRRAWDLLLLHQGRIPLFSTFDTWRPSFVSWWVGGHVCAHALSASTPPACSLSESPVPARPCLPKPQLGTKVQRGITGWGAQVTPLPSASLGQVDTSPREGWGGVGPAVLNEEGDQCSNLPGTPPLPHIGACAVGVGVSPGAKGLG